MVQDFLEKRMDRAGCCPISAPELCLAGARFEHCLGYWLSLLSSVLPDMPGFGYGPFLQNPVPFRHSFIVLTFDAV
jgi:hypothetical protein